MRGGESGGEKKKRVFIPKDVCDKREIEGRCIKSGRSNHRGQDCKAPSRGQTPLFPPTANQKPVRKKRKFDKEHLKITKLSSEEDLGKE